MSDKDCMALKCRLVWRGNRTKMGLLILLKLVKKKACRVASLWIYRVLKQTPSLPYLADVLRVYNFEISFSFKGRKSIKTTSNFNKNYLNGRICLENNGLG